MADPAEQDRLAEVYRGYGQDPRRQRAWAADNPGNVAIRAEVAAGIRTAAGDVLDGAARILDAGCGTGYWLRWLADTGVAPQRLSGVDLVPERVEAAQRRVPGADVRLSDVRTLPFADASFGLVLLLTVLSSQRTPEAMRATLAEARRVTAPGGVVVVWDVRWALPRRPTVAVPRAVLAELGDTMQIRSATLLPPLARRLGRFTGAYGTLARVPGLRTHWLASARR